MYGCSEISLEDFGRNLPEIGSAMYTLEHDKRAIELGNEQEDDGAETSSRVRQRAVWGLITTLSKVWSKLSTARKNREKMPSSDWTSFLARNCLNTKACR